ncbi:NAD(P)/FAD-dependent oxidoreductase [Streptomyces peucetius]|uniref:FAD-dependent oxidoreductase n=1 Tax=Streptomyces peucetius TaxID=1950 RepID=A0ABY6IJF5_STRPE|nr:FAD-dependent oxidoreductase [Streptomyces peucetius]UYQ65845.1 FAD-dependent oxidoreductase [Streptomyces peucetius]
MNRTERAVDVLVVGAGPAGLAAAAQLAAAGAGRVEVLEREQRPGGIPRHSHHRAFGPRHRPVDGPRYAGHLVDAAVRAGAAVRTGVTATHWAGPRTLDTTGPDGLERVTARAVVLATGARERPRSARLVPGTRPAGVLTTGELQQTVHLYGGRTGRRAVVVGSEAVALHAVSTLRADGAHVVALVTEEPAAPVRSPRHRVPVITGTAVAELTGRGRLTGVRLRGPDGSSTLLDCDTVVFTGDWIPDHELARLGGAVLDAGTRGPAVDSAFRTSLPGVFAVGNLLHGVEPAAIAAAEGHRAAAHVLLHLAGAQHWPHGSVPLEAERPLLWIAPNLLAPHGPPPLEERFTLRAAQRLARPVLLVSQDGRELDRQQLPRTALPGRAVHLRAGWTTLADPDGGPVRVTVVSDFRQPGTGAARILAV